MESSNIATPGIPIPDSPPSLFHSALFTAAIKSEWHGFIVFLSHLSIAGYAMLSGASVFLLVTQFHQQSCWTILDRIICRSPPVDEVLNIPNFDYLEAASGSQSRLIAEYLLDKTFS